MTIKYKKRFIRAIILILAISIVLMLIMSNKALSHQEVKYKSVSVTSGDTLWDIADKEQKTNNYYKGNDIRDVIENIKSVNNLKSSSLKINQILDIPTY